MTPFIVSVSVLMLVIVGFSMGTIAEWIDFKVYKWEEAKERRSRRGQEEVR